MGKRTFPSKLITTALGKYWMTSAEAEKRLPAGSQPADVVKDPLEETAGAR